jgi:peptide-methionine (S)-S-oxide reductase
MANEETITLGGGCFWCLEGVYQEMKGVTSVVSGYMGGHVDHPTYNQVCSGTTGHVEVVQIGFDPDIISVDDILDVFFAIHDPTTKDRQGNDVGSQYRSVIFYHSDKQRQAAEEAIRKLEAGRAFTAAIVTEVKSAGTFYRAEAYHQNYFSDNPRQPYCQLVVSPKVDKFRRKFADKRRAAS